MMEAKRATTLGKGVAIEGIASESLEFISRIKAWGSYLKRFPEAKQGDSLLSAFYGNPLVEVSIKNDAAGDPFFTKEQFIANGISAKGYNISESYAKEITVFLAEFFGKNGMELIDIKMEFGRTPDGDIILSDEISPGSLRALIDGKIASKDEIYQRVIEAKRCH
jgi:phosphoribosylaminoimidazole-succinocarboxamide synthase